MIYLASPYSHPDPKVREERFRAVCEQAAKIFKMGLPVFSPIAHTHPIAEFGLPKDFSTYKEFDQIFIQVCDEVWVLCIDGWKESVGIQKEIQLAKEKGKKVSYLFPRTQVLIQEEEIHKFGKE